MDTGALGLQRHAGANQRAARADRGHKAIHLAIGISPNLWSRRFNVRLAIGDVVELVGPNGAVGLALVQRLGQPRGIFDVVVGVLVGNGGHFHQLRAEQAQRVFLFLRLRFGNNDDRPVTERIADDGQADAGIAGCALDDGAARLQLSALLGVTNDKQGGTVFD